MGLRGHQYARPVLDTIASVDDLAAIAEWPAPNKSAVVVRKPRTAKPLRAAAWGDTARTYPIASITKLLTAYAVLVAVEEQIVGLDDTIEDLPGATVRHLLAHASGLGPDGEVLAAPGTRRMYSNAGYERLARVVEEAAGMPFPAYLDEAVLQPLEMTRTALRGSAAAGAESTAADLARFAAELLAPEVIDPGTLAAATTVAFAGLAGVLPGFGRQEPNDWGLGFELRDGKQPHWTGAGNSPATFGHFGRSGTFLWVDPAAGVALVCLTDRAFGAWAKTRWPQLSDAVLRALHPAARTLGA